VGFAFVRKNSDLQPLFYGEQEKGLRRTGVHKYGMAKALELSYANLEAENSDFQRRKSVCNST
jgi:cysteine desulfurase